MSKLRIALYSPGMVGLGHIRRNLLLARRFAAAHPDAAILLLAEAREAGMFDFPPGTDCVSLPALEKDVAGESRARRLPVGIEEVVELRERILCVALGSFDPDVVIVDHLARGAHGELASALAWLERRGRARLVLGLRDVLEDPETVRFEWNRRSDEAAILQHYSAIWIYGDPNVYDSLQQYSFWPDVAAKVRFTGYLDPREGIELSAADSSELLVTGEFAGRRLVLCQVGGGQDGMQLADAFARVQFPEDAFGILLTGPFMPRKTIDRLREMSRANPALRVLDFIAEPRLLLARADCVITMGGYNSITEVLAFAKPALVVPRELPRREQLIRAERLCELGVIDMLRAQELSPRALSEWLRVHKQPRPAAERIDMRGLPRAARYLGEVLRERRSVAVGTRQHVLA
jgi:predicted glycosyltransferase